MPGERRLTSIKQLVSDMLFNANLTGTITIDEITNTVTVQLVEPITIDGTIAISSLPAIVVSSLPNVTIADIVNLNVDSMPVVQTTSTVTEPPVSLSITAQTTVNVSNVDILLLAANPNRKYLLIRNYSDSNAYVYIHLSATAATVGSGIPLKQDEWYEFPKGFIYTGQIRAISGTVALKEISITEGF